ncbi:uncharacterized protein LOC117321415 [Pecten maximus]|uniref:uncharacterized protein LOC117321415 n=1 Tax=Pecten maximus TaxID=6579 RepID=UPI0014580374|nr:uncharacterized protein LOC117321415 [Pecten maximus]
MFGFAVMCCIWLWWIQPSSGEPCAYDVHLIENNTGLYITWTTLGLNCGDTWLRIDSVGDIALKSSPMLVQQGSHPHVICRSTSCDTVNDITVIQVTTTTTTRLTTSEPLTQTPVDSGEVEETPTSLVTISVVCSVVVLAILVGVLVVFVVKRRRTHHRKEVVPLVNRERTLRREDIEHRVNLDEHENEDGNYAEIGAVSHLQSDMNTAMVHPQDPEDRPVVGDMYAVVQKPTKTAKNNVVDDPRSMYAQVQKPSAAEKRLKLQEDDNKPNQEVSRHENKDGLLYMDVDFSDTPKHSAQPLSIPQSDCEYADVEHT